MKQITNVHFDKKDGRQAFISSPKDTTPIKNESLPSHKDMKSKQRINILPMRILP